MYTTMEVEMMKRQSYGVPKSNTGTKSSSLGMHKDSQMMISKVKPKIRIIHIFAPEIIKTDVANFRELVQRLTGKSSISDKTTMKKQPRIMSRSSDDEQISSSTTTSSSNITATRKLEIRTGFRRPSDQSRERIKGEEEIWGGANSGGGFLGGFADLEYGFMQELSGFHLLPLEVPHMDAFGSESQLAG